MSSSRVQTSLTGTSRLPCAASALTIDAASTHVVGGRIGAAAEAAAGVEHVDLHLLGLRARAPRRRRPGRRSGTARRSRPRSWSRRQLDHAVHRLHRRVREVRKLERRLERLCAAPASAFAASPSLRATAPGVAGEALVLGEDVGRRSLERPRSRPTRPSARRGPSWPPRSWWRPPRRRWAPRRRSGRRARLGALRRRSSSRARRSAADARPRRSACRAA